MKTIRVVAVGVWFHRAQNVNAPWIVYVLYKSDYGIIAYGTADGKLEKKDCDGYKDYEYYMHLDDFTVLKNPLSTSKIKELTKQGFPFRTTMFYMSEECKDIIMKEIKKNYL